MRTCNSYFWKKNFVGVCPGDNRPYPSDADGVDSDAGTITSGALKLSEKINDSKQIASNHNMLRRRPGAELMDGPLAGPRKV